MSTRLHASATHRLTTGPGKQAQLDFTIATALPPVVPAPAPEAPAPVSVSNRVDFFETDTNSKKRGKSKRK